MSLNHDICTLILSEPPRILFQNLASFCRQLGTVIPEKHGADFPFFDGLAKCLHIGLGYLSPVFTPNHRTVIKSLLGELGNLQRGLDRQLKQWRQVDEVTAEVTFRAREDEDDEPLAAVAKAFSERAHSVQLSIPNETASTIMYHGSRSYMS